MSEKSMRLWYQKQADKFEQALPVGNGKIGGMVYGRVSDEKISLNEDTLWSGFPEEKTHANVQESLSKVRECIKNDQKQMAEDIIWKNMLAAWTSSFQPAGDLSLKMADSTDEVTEYERELNLDTATASVRYVIGKTAYCREVFCSYPQNVILIRLTASEKASLSCSVSLDSIHPHTTDGKAGMLVLHGHAPSYAAPNYYTIENPVVYDQSQEVKALQFSIAAKAVIEGGEMYLDGNSITIQNADGVLIFVTLATNFEGFDRKPSESRVDCTALCEKTIKNAMRHGFDEHKRIHLNDYQELYHRVKLELCGDRSNLPTDERLKHYLIDNSDTGLPVLLFQFGRYLAISSSRPGTQAANLQGLWNESVRPPWSSNYTTNINAEMNYWPVESCNLGECHLPLMELVRELSENGKKTAASYGCRGWCAHHNTDLWRQSEGVGQLDDDSRCTSYGFWPVSGAWLSRHIWEHYQYNQDTAFLRKYWDVLKESALFMLDWLVEDDKGFLCASPSISPENSYCENGKTFRVCNGSTMDLAIAHDIFDICLDAGSILDADSELCNQFAQARKKLRPYRIGSKGQLLEWDKEYEEPEIHHRHLSHLYGFYPGCSINYANDRQLTEACKTSLKIRGDESTGWGLGWRINIWARLLDGDHALQLIDLMLRPVMQGAKGGGVYENLFDAHPPFQIDGNFAVTAGIAEMLLQSHEGFIRILPALPKKWNKGYIKGLKARGNYVLDIEWEDNKLSQAKIAALSDGICRIFAEPQIKVISAEGKSVGKLTSDNCIEFTVRKGELYYILPI